MTATRLGVAEGTFVIAGTAPVLEWLYAAFQSDCFSQGEQYSQHTLSNCNLGLSDSAGSGHVASVALVDPSGASHPLLLGAGTYEVDALLPKCLPAATPAEAVSYTILVNDTDGKTTTLTTPPLGPLSVSNAIPPPQGAVITDDKPSFAWANACPTVSDLFLGEEGTAGNNVWEVWSTTDTQAAFNSDGTASEAALQPGHTYPWQLTGDAQVALNNGRILVREQRTTHSLFTEYEDQPAAPGLAGKLVYVHSVNESGDGGLIQGYNPDPHTRTWYGPGGAAPAWSPDGQKLMYLVNLQIWIDALDGTAPMKLPGPEGFAMPYVVDCRWAPDGQHIVYSVYDYLGSAPTSVWTAKADGSEAAVLASDATHYQRFPDWSPEGQWIAYRRFPLDDGQGLWLIHPDGTGAQPVLGTTLNGHPGVNISLLDEPSWSPDGKRLAVVFNAKQPDGSELCGIGTIAREGGPVQPVYLDDADHVCCASAKLPLWAPDGQTILFTSARQVPANPQWQNGYTEPGVEIWSMAADGSGQPTRLTYDYGYEDRMSWWMQKVFLDVAETYWAFEEIKACRDAGLVQGFADGTFQPEVVISRDQLAVYLARALAGGDAKVPAVTTKPSFKDVPAGYWAFKYIEYCLKHKVVTPGTGRYSPALTVNRGLMATWLARTLVPESQRPYLTGYTPPSRPSFPDVPKSDAAYKYIEYLHAHGVVNGYSDGSYHESDPVTRAQLAVFVARGFGLTD